jgi:two-component system, cell cycle sensor histidine kinase and response regulator CckA
MAIRYTDFVSGSSTPKDFVVRRRKPTLIELALIFLFALIMSVTLPVMVLDKMALIFWLCLLLGVAGWYVIVEIQRGRDLVLATEFQNALFASALGFNNKFCLIIKREGSIVYMDGGFQRMFPDLLKERLISIAAMLKHGKVGSSDKEKVFAAIDRGVYDKVIFDIVGKDGITSRIVMSIEPIVRPSGFILLRAREYIEQRLGEKSGGAPDSPNPLLSRSSITLFSYIMDRMNTGVYMTDPTGNIIYANPVMEQWLSFREGEVISSSLSLKDIVHQGSSHPGAISPGNFEGEVTLQKKEGGLIKAFVNQKIIIGDDKKALGCVALINNIVERDSSSKKSLW